MKKRMTAIVLAMILALCTLCGCSAKEGAADTSADQTAAGTSSQAGGEDGSSSGAVGEPVTCLLYTSSGYPVFPS